MTITTRLKINALLSIGLVLMVGLLFGLAFRVQSQAHNRAIVAQELMKGAFGLNILSDRYLRYPEERLKEQWQILHDSLDKSVWLVSQLPDVPQAVGERMDENLNDMKILFDRLVATNQAIPGPEGAGTSPQEQVLAAQRSQLTDLMLKRAREISQDATRISAAANIEIEAIQRRLMWGIPVTAIVLILLAWGWGRRISRSIVVPLRALQAGSAIIGSGNLDYRVGMARADEIGELSRAFDQMAGRLKETTISRDEFERRVAERTVELESVVEELRRSNDDLEKFAYISSHDLQEPLRMVRIYVGLLAEHYKDQLDDEARVFIGYAEEGAARMSNLIKDLLAYSRVNTRKSESVAVEATSVMNQVLATLKLRIEETQAQVTYDNLPTVQADPTQLMQIFQNLIENGLKYRKEPQPPRIHVTAELRDHEWLFSVRDNGIGIDPQFHEKIYLPFQRLHADRGKYPGSGIGLAIVKRIVERHHGRVCVDSKPGEGSTFYFTLPVCTKDAPASGPWSPVGENFSG